MSDTGSSSDNKPQQQDEVNLESSAVAPEISEVENKPVTPVKRTPSKRVSAVERAQRESEELVKTMGGSLDIEGGRKTRSSTRGTPSRSKIVDTPPPTKKARASNATPRRGKGRKLDTTAEDETKTTPEKISSEPESVKEEDEIAASVAKIDDIVEDVDTETPAAVDEEDKSPAKQDDKPEPMEVDGVAAKDEPPTPADSEHVDESTQKPIESNTENEAHEEEVEDSDTPVAEQQESSSAVDEVVAATPVEEAKVESKPFENSVGNNIDANNVEEKVNSEVSPTTPPPAPPVVSVAGNDHKAESNDFCEPKIASPPITANNEGATPQYCN